jgi:DNA-binding CsgD family transcriptional regulator
MTALRAVDSSPASPVGFVAVRLNERERRVLEMIAVGYDTDQIAAELRYSLDTVKNIVTDLRVKFGAHNRPQIVHEAHRHGWLSFGTESVTSYHARVLALEQRCEEAERRERELRAKIERVRSVVR